MSDPRARVLVDHTNLSIVEVLEDIRLPGAKYLWKGLYMAYGINGTWYRVSLELGSLHEANYKVQRDFMAKLFL